MPLVIGSGEPEFTRIGERDSAETRSEPGFVR
jgi:hypothetical protein